MIVFSQEENFQHVFKQWLYIFSLGDEIESLKHGLIQDDVKEESVKYINQFSKDMLKRIQSAKEVEIIFNKSLYV